MNNSRWDLGLKFNSLTSPKLPYSANLYGDDINNNLKDIQDMSNLGRNVGRSSGYANTDRFRGRIRSFSRGACVQGMNLQALSRMQLEP